MFLSTILGIVNIKWKDWVRRDGKHLNIMFFKKLQVLLFQFVFFIWKLEKQNKEEVLKTLVLVFVNIIPLPSIN